MLLQLDSLLELQALIYDLKVGEDLDMTQPMLPIPPTEVSPVLLTFPLAGVEGWEGALEEEWEEVGDGDGGKSLTAPLLHASSIDAAWDGIKQNFGKVFDGILMELYDLKTEKEWQEMLDALSLSTKMTACLTDREGNIMQSSGERNPLCAHIRKNEEALTFICSQTNRSMLAEVTQTRRPVVDLGEAGLCRMVVPVIVRGEMVGMVTACGAALEGEEIEEFLIAKQLGLGEDEVVQLAKSTPLCKEEDIGEVAEHLFDDINASFVGAAV